METPTPPPSRSPAQLRQSPLANEHVEELIKHAVAERESMPSSPTATSNASERQEHTLSSSMTRSVPVTRTVAIIKNHALQYRFDIEPRIQEASFEIVKERQMEFDVETDPDALYDLFGDDADSLGEGPVWVYVLERKRAVEVWNTLMGNHDPEIARAEAPNSLRALYGISLQQNALMGSPDTQIAEVQISALFASSPPFRSTDLPSESDADRYNSVQSISSSILESLRTEESQGEYASGSAAGASANGNNGKSPFRARPVPATNAEPDIVPRMTRAAALRITGVVVDDRSPSKPRTPISKERHTQTFANVPGHKRAETIAVASTAPPTIAPRMTKAASLRIAKDAAVNGRGPVTPPMKKRSTTNGSIVKAGSAEKAKATFEGIPGHKRRETISVASVRPPTVSPRLNKSAALRQMQKEGGAAPPTSFKASPPALSRTTSAASGRQSVPTPASLSQTPSRPAPSRRASSALDMRISKSTVTSSGVDPEADEKAGVSLGTARPPSAAGRLQRRPSSVAEPPRITPRTNKSAALRAAKMEAEAQAQAAAAAAAAAKKKTQKVSRPPPSSFKAVAT